MRVSPSSAGDEKQAMGVEVVYEMSVAISEDANTDDGLGTFELPLVPLSAKVKSLSILGGAVVAAAGVGCAIGMGIYHLMG